MSSLSLFLVLILSSYGHPRDPTGENEFSSCIYPKKQKDSNSPKGKIALGAHYLCNANIT